MNTHSMKRGNGVANGSKTKGLFPVEKKRIQMEKMRPIATFRKQVWLECLYLKVTVAAAAKYSCESQAPLSLYVRYDAYLAPKYQFIQ